MKRSFKHLLSLATILIFVVLGLASVPSKNSMSVAKGNVPPEIKGYQGTILMLNGPKYWNKGVEKSFTKYYTGAFEFVDQKDVNTKYPDAKKYRFTLEDNETFHQDEFNNYSKNTYTDEIIVKDRINGKEYDVNCASAYGPTLNNYAQVLEKERISE